MSDNALMAASLVRATSILVAVAVAISLTEQAMFNRDAELAQLRMAVQIYSQGCK